MKTFNKKTRSKKKFFFASLFLTRFVSVTCCDVCMRVTCNPPRQCDVHHRLNSLEGRVRAMILDSSPGTCRRRALVHTLIALRQHQQVPAAGGLLCTRSLH